MKVSIIIPVYNVEKYLDECLNSALNQTLSSIEIICVNDGSTDKSEKILKDYKTKYENIIIINQNNRGVSVARNAGLKVAKGKYIYFLDSDDYISEEAMKVCYQECEKDNLDILTFDADSFYDKGYMGHKLNENYIRKNKLNSKVMKGEDFYINCNKKMEHKAVVWLSFWKREFIDKNQLYFYEDIVHEDEIYISEGFLKADRVKYIPKNLYRRRVRDDSIMTSKLSEVRIKSNVIIANETYKLLIRENIKEDTKQILLAWIRKYYSNAIGFCDVLNLNTWRREIIKDMINKKDVLDIKLNIQIDKPSLYYEKKIV